jgi:hypothetical protein
MEHASLTPIVRVHWDFELPFGASRLISSAPMEFGARCFALDALAVLQPLTGLVIGLISFSSSYRHITLTGCVVSNPQHWETSCLSLSRFRSFLLMLNWWRYPAAEQRKLELVY